jgi:hypothetical protein
MRHEKVFISVCPYCQTFTLTGASNIPSTERNFCSVKLNSLSGHIDIDMEMMNGY